MKPKTILFLGLLLLVLGIAVGLYLSIRVLSPKRVEQSFLTYIEGLAETGKLVLMQGRELLTVRESAKGQLFGDTTLGDLLHIRSDAVVELSAWAELSWAVDLADVSRWSLRRNKKNRALYITAPPLQTLTPALRTETLEARILDRSIFLDEKKMVESVRYALTGRFEEIARATSQDPGIRAKAAEALSSIALAFCGKFDLDVDRVEIVFDMEE
jgi:hypothetical protein